MVGVRETLHRYRAVSRDMGPSAVRQLALVLHGHEMARCTRKWRRSVVFPFPSVSCSNVYSSVKSRPCSRLSANVTCGQPKDCSSRLARGSTRAALDRRLSLDDVRLREPHDAGNNACAGRTYRRARDSLLIDCIVGEVTNGPCNSARDRQRRSNMHVESAPERDTHTSDGVIVLSSSIRERFGFAAAREAGLDERNHDMRTRKEMCAHPNVKVSETERVTAFGCHAPATQIDVQRPYRREAIADNKTDTGAGFGRRRAGAGYSLDDAGTFKFSADKEFR